MNLRDKFFSVQFREETVNIPEVGDVLVRELSIADMEAIYKRHSGALESKKPSALTAETLIASCLDPETKEPVWTAADRDKLMKMPPRVLTPLVKVFGEISAQTIKAVEEAEKNSLADAASSSSSPGNSDALSANSPSV